MERLDTSPRSPIRRVREARPQEGPSHAPLSKGHHFTRKVQEAGQPGLSVAHYLSGVLIIKCPENPADPAKLSVLHRLHRGGQHRAVGSQEGERQERVCTGAGLGPE